VVENVRSVPEWIGKTDDTPVPNRVKLRVFERYKGICHLTGRKILPGDDWDCDHIKSLKRGGENRESNLAPALRAKHIEKTAKENSEDAKTDRLRQKHLGIIRPNSKLAKRNRWGG
jgi:5-methylcytosine-specific restriction protein A